MNKLSKQVKILGVFVAVLLVGITGASLYYYDSSDLSSGTFVNTSYNASNQIVILNWSDATNTSYAVEGNYTSDVIDFGATATFSDIKWEGNGSCAANMSYINKFGGYCIDQYEASKPDATSESAGSNTSFATSKQNVVAWVSISQINSRTACENANKHLCTSEEWLGAANIKGQVYNLPTGANSGTRIPSDSVDGTSCVTYSQCAPCDTGSQSDCVSSEGVYDMVGNLWEWTNETVNTTKPCNSGSAGWCYPSDSGWQTSGDSKYGSDGVYFLAGTNTGRAVERGGDWNDEAIAGGFCAALNYAPSAPLSNIGFRCCSG